MLWISFDNDKTWINKKQVKNTKRFNVVIYDSGDRLVYEQTKRYSYRILYDVGFTIT